MLFQNLIKDVSLILFSLFMLPLYAYAIDDNVFLPQEEVIDFRKDSVYQFDYIYGWLDVDTFVYVDTLTVNPMFMPVIFDGKVLPDHYNLTQDYQPYPKPSYIPEQAPTDLFRDKLFARELNRKAYLYLTMNDPTAIKYAKGLLPDDIPVAEEIKVNPFKQLFQVEREVDFSNSEKPEMSLPKRRYWTSFFETSLKFSQNYISENWHKGGNSNFNLLSINKFKHEYEKERVKVSTTAEYKLSIYTTPTDTLRSYRIGDDAFSLVSSYGYKAFSNWFYSVILDARTQLFSNYFENKTTKSSAFLSPVTLNLGLGMEYKLSKQLRNKHRKIDVSTNISPFSYNMKYIKDKEVDRPRHGLKADENFLKNFGSKLLTTVQFNITRNIAWNSRVYYFTNYEKVEAEFENTLNLGLSRFFSTRIYCNVRFDDSVKKDDPKDSYFQYYEILSFGFDYRF